MSLSPLPSPRASRPVTPDLQGALHEHGTFVHHLVGFANQIASHYQGVVNHFDRQQDAHNNLLATKNAEIERIVDNEAVLRRAHETQLIAEQQQWYVEKDTLQKALQEQQGIAFALQQQQQERISELEGQLQIQESCHSTAVTAQHETIVDLQDTIVNLQQQQQQLQQDLAEAFAYRQKCVVQKQRIQQMEKRLPEFQHGRSPQQAQVSGNDPIDLTKDVDRAEAKGADDAEVQELRRSREVLKQAYHKEKTKADRYRNAYKNLRDVKQPAQIANRHRGASVATSMPHMGSNARLNSTPAEMASDSIPEAAAPKPVKAKPSKQHCFTAEMDLAAAGFLQPTPAPAVATRLPHDSAVPVISVRHSSDELQPKVSSRASLQRHSLQGQPQCFQPARSHRSAHTDRQADPACSSEELSPAAKELLIATGLMSEEQDPGQIPVQGPVQLLLQHQQQNVDLVGRLVPVPTSETCATEATSRHQLAQQQDRVLNMADAVQQLDGDSICRISDACHQPAKRSRSCLPEGCQAEEAQLSSSQTVSEAQEDSGWANSHPDEVMSEHQPDLLQPEPSMKELQIHGSAPEHCGQQQQQQQQEQWQSHQHQYSQQQQHHHHPGQAAFGAAPSEELAAEPIRPAIAASPRSPQACAVPMQYDSLEITQPNLTPAPHAAPGMHVSTSSTSPNENQAPTGNLPSGSGHPAAFVPLARHDTQPRSAAPKPAALLPQQRVHYHSSNASTGQYAATAQPRMGKTNSGKWRQRAGQRDAAFAGTDEPHVITSEALLGQPQQLQQPELPSLEAVHAVGAAGNVAQPRNADGSYKYQEVVRKKAEREALQGIQCLDCRHFYEAVNTWGHAGPLPACGHVQQGSSAEISHRQAAVPAANQQMHQDASRHRYRHAPPGTPTGFWDMGFADSLDSRI